MEQARDYELKRFFGHVIAVLEQLGIPYMIVEGFAAILYGEPRLTVDVDVVVDMHPEHVAPFAASFPADDYYLSEETIYDALRRRYLFNVIESHTGAKVDLVPLPADAFTRAAFGRRQRLLYDAEGHSALFIGPEDIVLAKLLAYHETGSDKHLRDARGVLVMQGDQLDLEALREGARATGTFDLLEELLRSIGHLDEELS